MKGGRIDGKRLTSFTNFDINGAENRHDRSLVAASWEAIDDF
jgi:hypothetical protein